MKKDKFKNREIVRGGRYGYLDVQFLPNERGYGRKKFLKYVDENAFVFTDPHLNYKEMDRMYAIVDMINKVVGEDDTLVCLGDWDGRHGINGDEGLDLIYKFFKDIKCKHRFNILGNNDPWEIKELKDAGKFEGIDTRFSFYYKKKKVILSHCPLPTGRDEFNIHGHNHGSRKCWGTNGDNHFDVFVENFNPIRIKDCIKKVDDGEYMATKIHHDFLTDGKSYGCIVY